MMVPEEDPAAVAGTVALWPNEDHGPAVSEIGWMVLPACQGFGLAKSAVRALLERARDPRWQARWGIVHAFPAVANEASNAVCRAVGFSCAGVEELEFAQQKMTVNHWLVDPATI
jgi:RimJ/RimL family protein N-acetyltransferase